LQEHITLELVNDISAVISKFFLFILIKSVLFQVEAVHQATPNIEKCHESHQYKAYWENPPVEILTQK